MEYNADITKMGYFVLYRRREGFHPLEWLIYKEQLNEGFSKEDAEFVHVETIIAGDETINHAFPIARRCKISKKHKGREVKIVAYNDHNYFQYKRYKVSSFAASLNNTIYGIVALLWFKINKNNGDSKRNNFLASRHMPFCSFGSAWALKRACSEAFDNSSIVMPAAFSGEDFTVVWQGVIE